MSDNSFKQTLMAGIAAMFLVLGTCLLPAGTAAAAVKTAVVTGSVVNVRSGPGTGYSKVATVKKGQKYEIIEEKNGWYRLKLAGGSAGWAIGSYLSVSANNTNAGSQAPSLANGKKPGQTITVKSDKVNVRSGPATGYAKIAQVKKGQSFPVLRESGGWYGVSLGNGKSGWIAGWLVTVNSNAPPGNNNSTPGSGTATNGGTGSNGGSGGNSAPAGQETGTYLVVKGSTVNIRSGAGTGYSIVARVRTGERLKVLKQSGDWYLVELAGGKRGWIAGWLTEVRPAGVPSRGDPDLPVDADPSGQPEPKPETPEPGPAPPATGPGSPGPGSENPAPVPAQKLYRIEFGNAENREEVLVINGEGVLNYRISRLAEPARLVVDIANCDVNGLKDPAAGGNLVSAVRVAQYSLTPMAVRVVLDLNKPVNYTSSVDETGKTLTVTLSEPSIKGKVIVIDAGHGGYDPGAIGVTGLQEKEVNLATALLVKEKLTAMGATVVMTREGDDFISLSERARVANAVYADVFVSIHANSSESPSVKGTSTYYYAPSSDPVLYAQRDQRKKLAETVQGKLISALGTRDVGTLQANFAVLRGTNMPSILVETAFVSNADDEALLKDGQFRDKVAQAIADGLAGYFANP